MKANGNIKPAASLDASMLARKGEAQPAIVATVFNNPALAWERANEALHTTLRPLTQTEPRPANRPATESRADGALTSKRLSLAGHAKSEAANKPAIKPDVKPAAKAESKTQKGDAVAMIFKMDEAAYLRLKYQAQMDGRSSQELIRAALDHYLDEVGAPKESRWRVRPG